MAVHVIYRTIVRTVKAGKLLEPFSLNDLIKACPYLNKYTCMVFLSKHRQGNPSETSQLFEIINATIMNESNELALIQSANFAHVENAKMLYHWGFVFKNMIKKLAK